MKKNFVLFALAALIGLGCSEEVEQKKEPTAHDVGVLVNITGPTTQDFELGATKRTLLVGSFALFAEKNFSSDGRLPESPLSVYDMVVRIQPYQQNGVCRVVGSKGTSFLQNARLKIEGDLNPLLAADYIDPQSRAVLDQFGHTIYRNGKLLTEVVSTFIGSLNLQGHLQTRGDWWSIEVDVAPQEDAAGEFCGCGFVADVVDVGYVMPGARYDWVSIDPNRSAVFRVNCR